MPFYRFLVTRGGYGREQSPNFTGLVYADSREEAEEQLEDAFSATGHPLKSIATLEVAKSGITREMRREKDVWRKPHISTVYGIATVYDTEGDV